MHCTCRVFCGRGIESWRAHRDDLLILHPGADTLEREHTATTRMTEGLRAAAEAYARAFRNMGRVMAQFDQALAANLRRGNEARARQARIDAALFLNRPVITPPDIADKLKGVTDA
jgi:hypothetical protein